MTIVRCFCLMIFAALGLCATPTKIIGQDQAGPRLDFQDPSKLLAQQKHAGFEVFDLTKAELEAVEELQANPQAFKKLFQLRVRQEGPLLNGKVLFHDRRLVFEPRFPIDRDVAHYGSFDVRRLGTAYSDQTPIVKKWLPASQPTMGPGNTISTAVYPVQKSLPQNILRMYLQFDQPMSQTRGYDYISFENSDGKEIAAPFLEIPQALWSSDGKRLTLLFDPGRIKRGLARHEQFGPPFEVGENYTLVIGEAWKSADHRYQTKKIRHPFTIEKPDRTQPSIDRWKLDAPAAGTSNPLVLHFDEPLDFGMLQHSLEVKSANGERRVSGKVTVAEEATRWSFVPEKPWAAGQFVVVAKPRLEDRSGNSLAQPFERKLKNGKPVEPSSVKTELPFEVVLEQGARTK